MSIGATRTPRPVQRTRVLTAHAGDSATDRAIDALAEQSDTNRPVPRSMFTVDLLVGVNRIVTGLGRRAQGATLAPSVASPAFAWSFAVDDDRTALITILGVDQPGASMEFY